MNEKYLNPLEVKIPEGMTGEIVVMFKDALKAAHLFLENMDEDIPIPYQVINSPILAPSFFVRLGVISDDEQNRKYGPTDSRRLYHLTDLGRSLIYMDIL